VTHKPIWEVIDVGTATRGRRRFTDEQLEQANSVNLLELARQYGYELENTERRAYHAKHSGGLLLQGQQYIQAFRQRYQGWRIIL
jgi:hypothetical protein